MGLCASSQGGVRTPTTAEIEAEKVSQANREKLHNPGKGSKMTDSFSRKKMRTRSPSMTQAMLQKTEPKPEKSFDSIRKELRSNAFFSVHTPSQLDDIARFMKQRSFTAGEIVYEKGQRGNEYYILETGSVEASSGDSKPPKVITDGGSFGEAVLRYKTPRQVTIKAKSECAAWVISRDEYQALIVKEVKRQQSQYLGFLRKVDVLAQLTDEQLHALGKALKRRVYADGERIITQGSKGSSFFFVERGAVVCFQRTWKGGNEIKTEVNRCEEGGYFGEGALLKDVPRNADVVAKGEVSCLSLSRDDFIDLLGGLQELLDLNFTARVLKGVDVFKTLTDSERIDIAESLVTQLYKPNELIIKQGDPGDKFFIIKEGEVLFTRKEDDEDKKAKPKEIGRLFTGKVFGEGALLTREPRRANAFAVGNVTLLYLEAAVFKHLLDESLHVTASLNRDFVKRRDMDSQGTTLMEFGDLEQIKVLGAGTYGQVLLVSHKVTGKTFALKCMSVERIQAMEQEEHVQNEKKILEAISFPFVVNLVQTFFGPGHVYALIEAVLGGELFAYMRTVGKLKVKDAMFYISQVLLTFEYLHDKTIIYRDLKPENLLLQDSGYLKVTDFGLAKMLGNDTKTYTLCGTPAYAAPEVYNLSGHGRGVDWWTLGVLTHELISGTTPFDGDAAEIFASIEQYSRAYPNIRLPRGLTGDVEDFVLRLLHPNPTRRLGSGARGAREVKGHNFFKAYSWSALMSETVKVPHKPKIKGMYDTGNFYEPVVEGKKVALEDVDVALVKPGAEWQI